MNIIKTVLFDFDGVLCSDYFYFTLAKSNQVLYEAINNQIFRSNVYKDPIANWMRGQLTYQEFNRLIAPTLQTSSNVLDNGLVSSVQAMTINQPLLDFSQNLRQAGVKTLIFTDNMDIFEKVAVPHHHLDQYFDAYYSSHTYGKLKKDDDWQFLSDVITTHNSSYSESLLIDDSASIGEVMRQRGGQSYVYPRGGRESDFAIFSDWFKSNIIF